MNAPQAPWTLRPAGTEPPGERPASVAPTGDAVQDAQRRLALALWASGEGIWEWSVEDDRLQIDAFELAGAPSPLQAHSLKALVQQVSIADRDSLALAFRLYLRGARDDIDTAFRLTMQGRLRWLRLRGRALERDAQGRPRRVIGTIKDVTEQRDAEQALHLMAHAFAHTHDALVVVDATGCVVQANEPFAALLGQDLATLEGRPLPMLVQFDGDSSFPGHWRGEATFGGPDGVRHVELSVTPVDPQASQQHSCWIVALRDISARRRAEQELRHMALHDALTGLPNRAAITRHLHERMQQGLAFAMLFLDLDGFKPVNDSLGHRAGDEVLCRVAGRLRVALPRAFLGRWGGDEFVVVLDAGTQEPAARLAAERLIHELGAPIEVEGHTVLVTPSLGAVCHPSHGSDGQTLLRRADAAMYAAKSQGRNRLAVYHPAMDDGLQRRTRLQGLLRQDAERDAFHFVVQPKVNGAGRPVGAELLMRWTTADFGAVSPAEFIPLAEQSGLIERMGRLALAEAARIARELDRMAMPVTISVNLSPRQLLDDTLEQSLDEACRQHGAQPWQLELELTESALVSDIRHVAALLVRLRDQGYGLALDDFGTGYSSLSHLRQLPFHKVKIDRSFVRDLGGDNRSALVLQGIVELCERLELTTVAEGVETEEQFRALRGMGVGEFQGFLFSRPRPVQDWLAEVRQAWAEGQADDATG